MSAKLLMVFLPCFLAGCVSLDPHYDRPKGAVNTTAPTGDAYRGLQGTPGNYRDISWQDYVLDTHLRQVVAMALDSSRDLREAVASVKSAHAQYGEQRADLFPTISAGVSGTRSRALTGEGNQTALSNTYSAEGSVSSFELDLFGKNQSLTRQQYETYLGTLEGARSTRLTVLYNTVDYWLQLAADRSNLAIAKETAESARQSLEVTRKRLQNGVDSMVDVASAETTYQSAQADVASYTTSVAQDKNALDLVVGKSVPDNLLPQSIESIGNALRTVPAGVSSDALNNRPDVLQAEHNLKAANANIGAARANFFPSISLTASGGVGSSDLSSLFKNGAGIWSFAPSISLPIFKGGYNVSYLNYTKAQKEYYVAVYEKAVQTAFQEVADALARRGTINDQLTSQRNNVAASQTYYHLADLRYQNGVDTYLNALTAQRTLYTARTSLVSVEQAYYQNLNTFYKVLGGGTALKESELKM
ncbi:efflux transporter outer membrane subunit [Pantoea sp. Acro-805]|uniref:Efflux transporter outer membrane subunit n=1 Tax=Candidatus Pantoea formicae TaxID=2608355 RepID=A0ABX0QXD8_9GAMM|nr:efflux transporter outer membrane subunit [Pantoea formicae]MDF7649601.1 efflux transporter outer membrane subunit [Erwiniaceae bacterium L1_54_3]NIF00315.1 efflux transporter outer membrane subunit [Pantoea formicae]